MLDKMESEGILPDIPVIVDSPLAINVTQIYRSHPECFDQELHDYLLTDENPFGFNRLKYAREVSQSKALNDDKNPCIIISASGMMNAGRIRHHLFNNIENPKNTFLIVGYCSPETPGGMLRAGAEKISIFYEEKEVLAEVEIMDSFSAHGDRNEMYQFIAHQKTSVKRVFLVHGEPETMGNFKSFLTSRGFGNILIPNKGEMASLSG
jgi:metallo-beta-lactamase family protein